MNIAQLLGLLRVMLGALGGATALAPLLHTTPDAINGVVNAASPGAAVVGAIALVGAAGWTYAAHTVSATVDRAVGMASTAAAKGDPAPAANAVQALTPVVGLNVGRTQKTRLNPNG